MSPDEPLAEVAPAAAAAGSEVAAERFAGAIVRPAKRDSQSGRTEGIGESPA